MNMEKLFSGFKKVYNFFSENFIFSCTVQDQFDDDFRQLLQVFYFFGFYSISSKKRRIFGWLVFVFLMLVYLLGWMKDVITSFEQGFTQQALIDISLSTIIVSYMTLFVTFMTKQVQIIKTIEKLQSLHESEFDGFLVPFRKTCSQVLKYFTIYILMAHSSIVLFFLSGYGTYKLVVPTIFDKYAEGYFNVPLLIVNILQGNLISFCFAASDMFPIFCMVRAGANLEILCDKLRHCTDDDNPDINVRSLVACICYHSAIRQ